MDEKKISAVTEAINLWLKDTKLNKHYHVTAELSQYMNVIECKYYCYSGVRRVRVGEDGVLYWTYTNGSFNKIDIKLADPEFFEKLEVLLFKNCTQNHTKTRKVYRQS